MKILLTLFVLLFSSSVVANKISDCKKIIDNDERLICYDSLTLKDILPDCGFSDVYQNTSPILCYNDQKFSDGSEYFGGWKGQVAHVQGTVIYSDGVKYEGDWKYGERHGYGTITYVDGNIYEGEWKNDEKHGDGTITDVDGNKIEGKWKRDKLHGVVTLIYKSGIRQIMLWENGERVE